MYSIPLLYIVIKIILKIIKINKFREMVSTVLVVLHSRIDLYYFIAATREVCKMNIIIIKNEYSLHEDEQFYLSSIL